ncbi:FG-GAP repeat domain-containing protein [Auriculariales sp. MPI-PUGE-AT-0066]|nr:FG-GAP repeat domain-containing protein [Auriculariales sp. MPI-PUGE-AT-0066]
MSLNRHARCNCILITGPYCNNVGPCVGDDCLRARAFSGKTTRIMPIGASITNGYGSSHHNGYRDDLYNLLEKDGNTVNMVGRQKAGDFHDPDNEGYPGWIIKDVNGKIQQAMPLMRPNIATILVGTNDIKFNVNVTGAPDRIYKLVEDVLNWPWPTLVILATLPPNADKACNKRIDAFNAALPGVINRFHGRWVLLADVHPVVKLEDLVDGTHPNDAVFARIGRKFYDAIKEGERRGWVAPVFGPPPKH